MRFIWLALCIVTLIASVGILFDKKVSGLVPLILSLVFFLLAYRAHRKAKATKPLTEEEQIEQQKKRAKELWRKHQQVGYVPEDDEQKKPQKKRAEALSRAKKAAGLAPEDEAALMDMEDLLDEEDQEEENQYRYHQNENWEADWRQTLRDYLGRDFSRAEESTYRELFGGDDECRFNLRMFQSRVKYGASCKYADENDYYRPRYDVLVKTGAVLQGQNIPPAKRLLALTSDQLRSVAYSMQLPSAKTNRDIRALLEAAGEKAMEKALKSVKMDVKNLFYFDPDAVK